ncbi:MAG: phosphatase PAP2 family protein [Fibrobacteres bacterium]|nr:phosphatase PAP2 family protein [Fibrobacterota bacterium]
MLNTLQNIDRSIFIFFNRDIANPLFDFIMPILTRGTTWILPLVIMGYLYWRRKHGNALVIMAASIILIGLSDLISVRLLKPLFDRARPCNPDALVEGGRFLVGNLRSLSFPSSHAFNSAAFAAYFTYFLPHRKKLLFGIAILIGFTRIYVGVHYPFDVAGGWISGSFLGFLYAALIAIIIRPRKKLFYTPNGN